jgi:hypothetical protein
VQELVRESEDLDLRPETWSRADEALDGHLDPDESVLTSIGALVRVALQFFDRCELVLTDRQLVVLKPQWPWGYRFERGMPRSMCAVVRHKQRIDGSQLLVVRFLDEDMCFYIPRRSRDGGVAILEALR